MSYLDLDANMKNLALTHLGAAPPMLSPKCATFKLKKQNLAAIKSIAAKLMIQSKRGFIAKSQKPILSIAAIEQVVKHQIKSKQSTCKRLGPLLESLEASHEVAPGTNHRYGPKTEEPRI